MLMKTQKRGALEMMVLTQTLNRSSWSEHYCRALSYSSLLYTPKLLFIYCYQLPDYFRYPQQQVHNLMRVGQFNKIRPLESVNKCRQGTTTIDDSKLINKSGEMILQFIMNSAKSFFPTRAEIATRQKQHGNKIYHISRQLTSQNSSYRTIQPQSTSNIFQQGDLNQLNQQIQRPIGGEQLFRKMDEMTQLRRTKGRKQRKASKEYWQRNVKTSISNNNQKLKRMSTQIYDQQPFSATTNKITKINKATIGEELFKSHHVYQSLQSQRQGHQGMKGGIAKSLQTIQPKFHSLRNIQKVDRQIQEYHDKKALLGEMDRQRPLIELCGDSYFEMILRNRFEDELKMPSFIYRIKDKFTQNKVISRLKNFKPNIMERRQMVLRGRDKSDLEKGQHFHKS